MVADVLVWNLDDTTSCPVGTVVNHMSRVCLAGLVSSILWPSLTPSLVATRGVALAILTFGCSRSTAQLPQLLGEEAGAQMWEGPLLSRGDGV